MRTSNMNRPLAETVTPVHEPGGVRCLLIPKIAERCRRMGLRRGQASFSKRLRAAAAGCLVAMGGMVSATGAEIFAWSELPAMPDALGLAGVYAGIVDDGTDGEALLVAGGANFPGGFPWDGARKAYHRSIFALPLRDGGEWRKLDQEWPEPVAYGMSVSLENGAGLFFGGKKTADDGANESALASVRVVALADGKLSIDEAPSLPQGRTEAYFRGGQRVPWLVAGLSIFATMLSALTVMGIPARAYQTDVTWYIGQLPILLVVPLVALYYLPFFRKLDLTSAYEYLEKRFNLATRVFASLSFILFHTGRIAIVLYLPALALAAVSDIGVVPAILMIGVLCVIYTVMGGIEAVVWTDAIQALVLMVGALLCLGLVLLRVDGGIARVYEIANADNKLFENLRWDNFDFMDGTTTAVVPFVAFFFNSLVPYTSGQDVVQRYVTTKDIATARRSLWTTMWLSIFGSMVFFALGTAIYAFYKTHPAQLDPAMAKTDSILPFYIMQQLPVGVSGLIIAAIFAAAQSTISSSLNSVATAWIKDFDARLIRPGRSDTTYLSAAKWVVLVIGLAGIAVACVMAFSEIESAFKTFNSLIGLTAGALGGLFALGVFTRRANGTGAFAGAVTGFACVLALYFSGSKVSGLLYAFIGFAVCFAVGYVVSLLSGRERARGLSIHG